jgi:hypothetical protein
MISDLHRTISFMRASSRATWRSSASRSRSTTSYSILVSYIILVKGYAGKRKEEGERGGEKEGDVKRGADH